MDMIKKLFLWLIYPFCILSRKIANTKMCIAICSWSINHATFLKSIGIALVIFIFSLLVFFFAPIFLFTVNDDNIKTLGIYDPGYLSIFRKLIIKLDNWEKVFAPAVVFFTGLSSIATIWLIYLQLKNIKDNNESSKRDIFANCMSQMFSSRNKIVDSISSVDNNYSGINSFQRLNRVANLSLYIYNNEHVYIKQNYSSVEKNIYAKIKEMVSQEKNFEEILKEIDLGFSKLTKHTLNPYFHNIYATLKMIYEDETLTREEKNRYLLMFRSQFTQQEFKIIYIHALMYADDDTVNDQDSGNNLSPNNKLKNIIEKTSFFQSFSSSIIKNYVNTNLSTDFAYKEGAFNPDQANR